MILQSVGKLIFEVQKLVQVMDKKTDENTQLSMENASLKETVAKMTKQITELSWKSFRPTPEPKDLLIADSTISDIDPQDIA
jgi:regulator of replication initiation timing